MIRSSAFWLLSDTEVLLSAQDGHENYWFVDLKNGTGSLSEGKQDAECTISTDDESFVSPICVEP